MGRNVLDFEAYDIAAAKLTVDGEIEGRKIARLALHLQSRADGPDVLRLQRRLWANELALVPRLANSS
jgi:hypothetical protein